MSRENPFIKSHENEFVRGDGFAMRKEGFPGGSDGPGLEFRPGETNETASKRQKKEELEREKLQQEREELWREEEVGMTLEEKAQRAEGRARQGRNWMVEWFENGIKRNGGEYSETLLIKQDGDLDREKSIDGSPPVIMNAGDLKNPEDLYRIMHKISQERPELDISFEADPDRKWIRYRVKKVEN